MPALLPSELPVRFRTRQHWVVLLTPPHKWPAILFAALLIVAVIDPNPIAWVLGLVALVVVVVRWWTWRADFVTLTGKRIIRTQGIPDIASAESSLRLDRISGLRLIETLWGNLLGYATIELEAPGEHPGVRHLKRIDDAHGFYLALRSVIFGEPHPDDLDGLGDPDPDAPRSHRGTHDTAPLPRVPRHPHQPRRDPPARDRFGRRTDWT